MSNADDTHFNEYPEQTRVKHEILRGYLYAYLTILLRREDRLRYIDGFAGRGSYGGADATVEGSPIKLLKLLELEGWERSVEAVFIEKDPAHFEKLRAAVDAQAAGRPELLPPTLLNETFEEGARALRRARPVPTFLFADPCGVDGLHFETIGELTSSRKSELLLFFNYDAINRIAGLGENARGTLDQLLGSEKAKDFLIKRLGDLEESESRERAILDFYVRLLRQKQKWTHVVPFRVEAAKSARASHYLIYAARHHLGFRIMKDVMWKQGHDGHEAGALGLAQSSRTDQAAFFHPAAEQQKTEILEALRDGPKAVEFFTKTLPERPDNLLVESVYRKRLAELAAEGKLELRRGGSDGPLVQPMKNGKYRFGKSVSAHRVY